MSFRDWLTDTVERYRHQSLARATTDSLDEFRVGMQRHLANNLAKPIWERGDWDVLVILDGCRTDVWGDVAPRYDLPTDGTAWSNAACSPDWIKENLSNYPQQCRTTGYVTANPFVNHDAPGTGSAGLTDDDFALLDLVYKNGWEAADTGVETVLPSTVTDHAIAAWRRREELGMDRLIIHYMQPHQPFRSRPDWDGVGQNFEDLVNDQDMTGVSAWRQVRDGVIDEDELWTAYADNLEWVLEDVTERLLPNLEGEVVLSADHGNALGEWGEWSHPPEAISPAVRRVPWETVQASDEQTVSPDVDVGDASATVDTAAQLEALGYV